jgi:hypothetical protein
MGRGPTHRPGGWGVRCPVNADHVGVQQPLTEAPISQKFLRQAAEG